MTPDEWEEVKFLRYFYDRASDARGPADMDIYDSIKQEFLDSNGYLPVGYFLCEDE
jgi:hypothetical protein